MLFLQVKQRELQSGLTLLRSSHTGRSIGHGLKYFATGFGADPEVGIRFDYEDWYFFSPDDLYETSGSNFRV